MATAMPANFHMPVSAPAAATGCILVNRRRRITSQAGHALEILGHAIEYLTDEFVHRQAGIPLSSPDLEAVQLLMALNRQVYFECPEAVTLGERLRSMLHLRAA
ncbi:MAG: hypothetical protein P4L26_01900 [Terracidiphilus sp.]|nr:hypothetical protein [Terracidiphilus sp.]